MRAGLARKEPELLDRWRQEGLFESILDGRQGAPEYVLHDGPPYANGHLHHGHILNKILKDIIVKDRTLAGFKADYIPGWDCHGLPIEVQVDKRLGKKKQGMSKAEIRRACRTYAEEFVAIQRGEFERLGIFGRFDAPYLTMNHAYEAQTLRELGKFARAGLLYKGLRPVNWCCVHKTALAEAEVEYADHRSPSIYVGFDLDQQSAAKYGLPPGAQVAIWTTTPWTIPANLAVCVHPELSYIAYPCAGRVVVFAEELAETFLSAAKETEFDSSKVVAKFCGKDLEGLKYNHPFAGRSGEIVLGTHVTTDTGTGCVHTAPGHGADDFDVGRRYGLEVLSPVDNRGVFTDAAGEFAGQKVTAANAGIIELLSSNGSLIGPDDATIEHRYAHCWRCHKPIITRATEQWWVAMDKPFGSSQQTLRARSLEAIEKVEWIPKWGKERIKGMLAQRPDWCLSRQRVWGVPICALYCQKCDHTIIDGDVLDRVAAAFEQGGADVWFERDPSELLGDLSCPKCGGNKFRREEDILDVWFDSGVSFSASGVQGIEPSGPVDLYLEGSDQHRGWFHSSLLCSLATRERAPYRQVLTHGFVVDGKGKKISKSKGNFVDPFKMINREGAEIMRLWVAAEDYRDDIRVSPEILKRLSELYRKLRNTLRFLIGNLCDFDPKQNLVAAAEITDLDLYAADIFFRASRRIRRAYEDHSFHVVMQTLNELCTVDLSAFYFDIIKDRLYVSSKTGLARRSAQTVLFIIARDLLRLMAPVFVFTAEEAWGHLAGFDHDPKSIHQGAYPATPGILENKSAVSESDPKELRQLRDDIQEQSDNTLTSRFDRLRELRSSVNQALEEARRQKAIGSSTEASVTITGNAELFDFLKTSSDTELADFFIVSELKLGTSTGSSEKTLVTVERAPGTKCARCWLFSESVGAHAEHPEVCERCATVIAAP